MTLTTLDPITALVVIDLQKGIVGMTTAHAAADIVARAAELARAFRRHRLPVVLVNVTGGAPGRVEHTRSTAGRPADWAELVPELGREPTDHLVTKRTWGAFTNTGLREYLEEHGVTEVVLAGISTSAGVESTARFAHELGFNVAFAVDAMTDSSLEAHTNSLTRIFPRLGETGATAEILELLDETHHS